MRTLVERGELKKDAKRVVAPGEDAALALRDPPFCQNLCGK